MTILEEYKSRYAACDMLPNEDDGIDDILE